LLIVIAIAALVIAIPPIPAVGLDGAAVEPLAVIPCIFVDIRETVDGIPGEPSMMLAVATVVAWIDGKPGPRDAVPFRKLLEIVI
jgi:hypothetical protein